MDCSDLLGCCDPMGPSVFSGELRRRPGEDVSRLYRCSVAFEPFPMRASFVPKLWHYRNGLVRQSIQNPRNILCPRLVAAVSTSCVGQARCGHRPCSQADRLQIRACRPLQLRFRRKKRRHGGGARGQLIVDSRGPRMRRPRRGGVSAESTPARQGDVGARALVEKEAPLVGQQRLGPAPANHPPMHGIFSAYPQKCFLTEVACCICRLRRSLLWHRGLRKLDASGIDDIGVAFACSMCLHRRHMRAGPDTLQRESDRFAQGRHTHTQTEHRTSFRLFHSGGARAGPRGLSHHTPGVWRLFRPLGPQHLSEDLPRSRTPCAPKA